MSSSSADEAAPFAASHESAASQAPAAARHTGDPNGNLLFAPLRNALLDSRQRWRDLVDQAADFAFETDEVGRFSFVMPDPALGWSAMALLGQPADRLLAEPADSGGFNPFGTTQPIRRLRTWLKRSDGSLACIALAAAPLLDGNGRQIGVRGLGIDVTEQDNAEAQIAAMLRRSEVLDHILTVMRNEVAPSNVMRAALHTLAGALGAEGVAVIGIRLARIRLARIRLARIRLAPTRSGRTRVGPNRVARTAMPAATPRWLRPQRGCWKPARTVPCRVPPTMGGQCWSAPATPGSAQGQDWCCGVRRAHGPGISMTVCWPVPRHWSCGLCSSRRPCSRK